MSFVIAGNHTAHVHYGHQKFDEIMASLRPRIASLCYLVILLSVVSCTKESVDTMTKVKSIVRSGTWRITKFIDSGTDETSNFAGYNFAFRSADLLNAANGINSYDGTWSITDSNSNDDSLDDLDFNISFNLGNNFDDLSDDWDFISQSSTKIELIDVSGGGGGTDYLTFEKN